MNANKSDKQDGIWARVRDDIVGHDIEVPILTGGTARYVFLDNGASTPAFREALDAMNRFMAFYSGVHRGTGFKSVLATKVFDEAHVIAGRFVGATPENHTVIFGKNTTEVVNKLANRCDWREGDVVITTLMEHHSNDLPWRKHARVIHIGVDDSGYLDTAALREAFRTHEGHVRFLAVTGASNITGIVNPIYEFAELAHAHGAKIFVDAAQLAPHRKIDILHPSQPGHIDFIAYSAHKMYAPFGIGVLVGPTEWFLRGDPDIVGGGVVDIVGEEFVYFSGPPAKEEAGSPNVPGAVALAASIKILERLGMDAIAQHEYELVRYAMSKLRDIPGLTIYGPTDENALRDKVGVISFSIDNVPHAKVAAILSAEGGIGVRSGCFCAHPYVKRLLQLSEERATDLYDKILCGDRSELPGLVRASFGCYNTTEDVDRLAEMLGKIVRGECSSSYILDSHAGSYWPEEFSYDLMSFFPDFDLAEERTEGLITEAS